MRRLAIIVITVCGLIAGTLTTVAGADDTHHYKVELDNAFGIVENSDIRVAGVNVGTVTDLDINAEKRAVVSFQTSGALGVLGEDTVCSSEPQSLIAEYFLDCQPKGPALPDSEDDPGLIPVEQTTQTVQADLVQNTLREPFKRRLQLLINEFGTALAGNPDALNEAIRRGAPALRDLEAVLDILGDHNRIIRDLNADSDRIISALTSRKEDVVRFIQEARDTAEASASRRADLSRDFEILDDFLAELRPTLAELETLAVEQTPLLVDLRAAAPGLSELASNLPPFNRASEVSLDSLGEAGIAGKEALVEGRDEIRQLAEAGKNAPATAELLADFLRDIDDPDRTTEIDDRAARDTGREAPTGYTGMESLLNYPYYQAGSTNQFDQVGHLLHFSLYFDEGLCGDFWSGHDPETGEPGVQKEGTVDELTTEFSEVDSCVAWLGDSQPGITEMNETTPYDPAVCPDGVQESAEALCHPPGGSEEAAASASDGDAGATARGGSQDGGGEAPAGEQDSGLPQLPDTTLPKGPDGVAKGLEDILGLPKEGSLKDLPKGIDERLPNSGADREAADQLLDFLFTD